MCFGLKDSALVIWTGWLKTSERRLAFLLKANYLDDDSMHHFLFVISLLKVPSSENCSVQCVSISTEILLIVVIVCTRISFFPSCFLLITIPFLVLAKRLCITHRVAWLARAQQRKLAVIFLGPALGLTKLLRPLVVCKVHHLRNFLLILHLRRSTDLLMSCPILIWLLFVRYLNYTNAGVPRSPDL